MSEIEIKTEELKVLAEKTRLKIMSLLKERGELSLSEISQLTGKAKSTIAEHLRLLLRSEYVGRKQINRSFIYFLTEKGRKILPLLEKEAPSLKIEEIVEVKKQLRLLHEINRITGKRLHLVLPIIAGLSMIIFGYQSLSSIILSLTLGLILGILDISLLEFIESAVLFTISMTLATIIRVNVARNLPVILLSILISASLSFLIFILAGGIAFLGVKLIIKEK